MHKEFNGRKNFGAAGKLYIKMEHEYNVSKTVLGKLKKGLEVEAANADRDIDEDYKSHLATELEKNPVTEYGVTHDQRYRQLESIISGVTKSRHIEC